MHIENCKQNPAGIYFFKVINENTKTKTLEWRQLHRSDMFSVNLNIFTHCSGAFIVDFEEVKTGTETLD